MSVRDSVSTGAAADFATQLIGGLFGLVVVYNVLTWFERSALDVSPEIVLVSGILLAIVVTGPSMAMVARDGLGGGD